MTHKKVNDIVLAYMRYKVVCQICKEHNLKDIYTDEYDIEIERRVSEELMKFNQDVDKLKVQDERGEP